MRATTFSLLVLCMAAMLAVAGCGETATLPLQAGMGAHPTLPPPQRTLLPTLNIATAKGWPARATPTAAPGLAVKAFANGLDHPRWLYVLPNGAFVGQHGSWNRNPRSGYKVIFVPFANGNPSGDAEDILTGFLNADGDAYGRPVGVVVDKTGALLVADDVGNTIWRVTPETKQAAVQR